MELELGKYASIVQNTTKNFTASTNIGYDFDVFSLVYYRDGLVGGGWGWSRK